jgi:hydrogenase expression/formation protein HypD
VRLANSQPRAVVFFAAGFETTTAPTAAMLAEGLPDNLSILLSGRLTWPAVAMLLDSGTPGFDALVAPGHVSTVMGPEEWHSLSTARDSRRIAGFAPVLRRCTRHCASSWAAHAGQLLRGGRPGGNPTARASSGRSEVVDATWRGIFVIRARASRCTHMPRTTRGCAPSYESASRKRPDDAAGWCARVVLGKISQQCVLRGRPAPRSQIGPCMVRRRRPRIWWSSGIRERAAALPR